MAYDWGPHYIIPSAMIKTYFGAVKLRGTYDEDLLHKELERCGLQGPILRITNPWYYRRKDADTWIKIGESDDEVENFAVRWDTSHLENGQYEILGLMHAFVKKDNKEEGIARQNIVEITVEN